MIPIKLQKNDSVYDLRAQEFSETIIELCEKHRGENRAIAFAFILYDFENPQIVKILNDINYWNALNKISGKFLSIYYIHSEENSFAEDLSDINNHEKRGLFQIKFKDSITSIIPLKNYFKLEEKVKIPAILFFQVEDGMISDYFLIELSEKKFEESFIELQDYIIEAVDRLKLIAPENYCNILPIFESLKQGVESAQFRKVLFKNVQKFPVQLLISWVSGKLF